MVGERTSDTATGEGAGAARGERIPDDRGVTVVKPVNADCEAVNP